ncbi:hypothetical protein B0H19DRAFT_1079424 [Mycena capillaripes]|nr:hypothetical protein B0H19DRAFT_1079424 [Mycena capillaripes]
MMDFNVCLQRHTSVGPDHDSPIHSDLADTFTSFENCGMVVRTELSVHFQPAVPHLSRGSFALRDHQFGSQIELNGGVTIHRVVSAFSRRIYCQSSSDAYALMFNDTGSALIAEEPSVGGNELKNTRSPTDYNMDSATAQSAVNNEYIQDMDVTDPLDWFELSQELPPLRTSPSIAFPTHTEAEEPPAEYEGTVAPRDINLKFDESNIVSGKRRRMVPNRAAQGEVTRPAQIEFNFSGGPHAEFKFSRFYYSGRFLKWLKLELPKNPYLTVAGIYLNGSSKALES